MRHEFRAAAVFLLLSACPSLVLAGDLVSTQATGKGPAVIFIPGLGSPASVWDGVVRQLSPRFTCVVVSIAGFGRAGSSAPAGPDALAAAIAADVRRGGWQKPVLVGHSYGGLLALSLAAAHPTLFGKVVIVDALPFPMGQVQPSMTLDTARQQAAAVRAAVLKMSDQQFAEQQRTVAAMSVTDPAHAATVAGWAVSSDRAAIVEGQFAMLSSDLRPDLPRITSPLLAIGTWQGREAFGFTHERIAALLEAQYGPAPDHRVIVSDTARHYVMLDEPSWLATTIAEFLLR